MTGMEVGEFVSLGFDLLMFPLLFLILVRGEVPRFGFFLAAAFCILVSHTATVIEAWYFPVFFNLLEHLSILLSGIFFITGFFRYSLFKFGDK